MTHAQDVALAAFALGVLCGYALVRCFRVVVVDVFDAVADYLDSGRF